MPIYALAIIVAAAIVAAGYWLVTSGFRNGDRAGDARVSALLGTTAPPGAAARPGQARAPVIVRVRNPSDTPLLAGLRVRRALLPPVLPDPHTVTVPRCTGRRRFLAGEFGTVGVVPEGGTAELVMPAPVQARRYLVTVVVGQGGSRLRVHRLRVGAVGSPTAGGAEAFPPYRLV